MVPLYFWMILQDLVCFLQEQCICTHTNMKYGKRETGSFHWKHIKCMGNKWNDRSVTVADHQDIMSELLHFRRLSKVLNYITSKYDTSTSDVFSSSGARYSSAMDAKPWDASKPERYSTKPPPPPHRSSTPGYGPGPKKHMASYLQDLKVSKKIVCILNNNLLCVSIQSQPHVSSGFKNFSRSFHLKLF